MIHGFTTRNWKSRAVRLPQEDSFHISNNGKIIAVADGVTLDCTNGKAVRKSLSGALDIAFHYPRPSHAKKAADLFTSEAVDYIHSYVSFKEEGKSRIKFDNMDRMFKATFSDINHLIKLENGWKNINYADIDYAHNYPAGCTGAVTIENSGKVLWGYLTDCGVAVVSPKGNLKAKTKDEGPGRMGNYGAEVDAVGGWGSLEGRTLTRKIFRNNPNEPRACGILNGMPEAMYYLRIGVFEKNSEDYLLVYSDGVEEALFSGHEDISGETVDLLRQGNIAGLEKLCRKRVVSEGTLVIKR
ncbi:hypothetical protein HYT23_05575 [Candidatus Pacearchaeota archaeon]|nr:hypothetical protein [Candidatus Pacearchaeota archaeon]